MRCLLVHCHPVLESFCAALRDAAAEIVNNNDFSGENAVYAVFDQASGWVEAAGPIIAAAMGCRRGAGR